MLVDILLLLTSFFLSLLGLFTVDKFVKQKKLRILTVAAFMGVYFLDNFLPLYHSKYIADDGRFRPTYTGFLILACYIFFDIYNKWIAFLLALFVTITGMAIRAGITYKYNAFFLSKVGNCHK